MAILAADSLQCGSWHDGSAESTITWLQDVSDNLPDGEVVGALLQFPYADGYALYVVVDAEPLTVQHVNYLDGWSVSPILIKGLDRQDVLDLLQQRKALKRLFASR